MALAKRSGQPFRDLLQWHPRDVGTLVAMYEHEAKQAEQQAREDRFATGTAELLAQMRQGR